VALVTFLQARMVGAFQDSVKVQVAADQVGRHGQEFKILDVKGYCLIREREQLTGFTPCPTRVALASRFSSASSMSPIIHLQPAGSLLGKTMLGVSLVQAFAITVTHQRLEFGDYSARQQAAATTRRKQACALQTRALECGSLLTP
jgi:hypothetical protein